MFPKSEITIFVNQRGGKKCKTHVKDGLREQEEKELQRSTSDKDTSG